MFPYDDSNAPDHSEGIQNPDLQGSKLTIGAATASTSSNSPSLAIDGSSSTAWRTNGASSPASAWIQFDLGSLKTIHGMKWRFSADRGADEFVVSLSDDGSSWKPLGTYANHSPNQFYGITAGKWGRYVRLAFTNPDNQPTLGFLAELEVWGEAITSAQLGTLNPTYAGTKLRIDNSSNAKISQPATRAFDNNLGTSWYSTKPYADSIWMILDLGAERHLNGIKWTFQLPNGGDRFEIETSVNKTTWSSVGTFQGILADEVRGKGLNRNARYVRFSVRNPAMRETIGYLSEVEIWGDLAVGTDLGSPNPTYAGSKVTIADSDQSSNSELATRAYDGSGGTSWYSNIDYPIAAWFMIDLGTNRQLTGVKWKFRLLDGADLFSISTSEDGSIWDPILGFGQAPADQWRGKGLNRKARFVRFDFENPLNRQTLGYVSEVEVWSTGVVAPEWTHQVVDTALNLRTASNTSAPIIGSMPVGTRLRVLGGPMNSGGYDWYNVDAEGFGAGWCVNGFEEMGSGASAGDWTHQVTDGPLNLRTGASTNSTVIGVMQNGTKLRLVGGPESQGGYSWYEVLADDIGAGWCVNGFGEI